MTEEEENGAMVYDFEFRAGECDKETDVAPDGTVIETTEWVSSTVARPPTGAKTGK